MLHGIGQDDLPMRAAFDPREQGRGLPKPRLRIARGVHEDTVRLGPRYEEQRGLYRGSESFFGKTSAQLAGQIVAVYR